MDIYAIYKKGQITFCSSGTQALMQAQQKEIIYQSIDGVKLEINGNAVRYLQATFNGEKEDAERVVVADGETLLQSWSREKKLRLEAAEHTEGAMPWHDFDPGTLRWYALRLSSTPGDVPETVVGQKLFDGRTRFFEKEINEARLLFGTEDVVRRTLKRDMIDLRARGEGAVRWDERDTQCANLLTSLQSAVDFFSRHIGLDDTAMGNLNKTEGSADYLAMREALVNLFVHQDYSDVSAVAQIELQLDCAIFFNTGYSLVSQDQLVEGGRSQARNPLIARALRLIGFAELAGPGIRALQTAWRQARRRPPQFFSDRQANTFTVTLDWRPAEDLFDSEWRSRLGVKLTPEHAHILNLMLVANGITKTEIASGTSLNLNEVSEALRHLQVQGLLDERDGCYYIKEHLKGVSE